MGKATRLARGLTLAASLECRGYKLRIELFKALYFFEWSRRDQLTAALTIPIAADVLLGGLLAFLLRQYPYAADWLTVLFVVLIGTTVVFLVGSVFWLARSYHGYDYDRLPMSGDLLAHANTLRSYYEGVNDAEARVDEDFDAEFVDRLVSATDVNARNNIKKAAHLHTGTRLLIFLMVFAGLATIVYLVKTLGAPETVTRVEIVACEPCEEEMKKPNRSQGRTTAQPATPRPTQPATKPATKPETKPSMPPNLTIKEDGSVIEKR